MALSTADGSRSECDAEVLERGGGGKFGLFECCCPESLG